MSTGLNSYVGIAEETTWGTYVAPTLFLPAKASAFTFTQDVLKSEGIVTGAFVQDASQVADGNETCSGRISYPLYRGDDIRLLLEHMFGLEAGNGSVATPWLYTPATLKGKGLSITIGKPDTGGTVRVLGYEGCKVTSWSIGVQPGAIATLDIDFVAETVATQSAPTVTTTLPSVYTGAHAAVTIAAGARSVQSLTISGENAQDTDRRFLGSNSIDEPLTIADRVFKWDVEVEFADNSDLATYLADPSAEALVATLTAGDDVLKFTSNAIQMAGGDPEISGKGRLIQPLQFECFTSGGVSSTALKAEQWDASVPT